MPKTSAKGRTPNRVSGDVDPKRQRYWVLRSCLGPLIACHQDTECPMLFRSESKANRFATSTGDPFLFPHAVDLMPVPSPKRKTVAEKPR